MLSVLGQFTVGFAGSGAGTDRRVLLAIVIAGLVAVAFIGSIVDASRDPGRYARVYDERLWRRVHVWVGVVTLAALAGALLGRARGEPLGIIAVAGLVAPGTEKQDRVRRTGGRRVLALTSRE